jgi:hypothetical protein
MLYFCIARFRVCLIWRLLLVPPRRSAEIVATQKPMFTSGLVSLNGQRGTAVRALSDELEFFQGVASEITVNPATPR